MDKIELLMMWIAYGFEFLVAGIGLILIAQIITGEYASKKFEKLHKVIFDFDEEL